MDDVAYLQALLAKLVEEAQEVPDAVPEQRMTELAHILEVMDMLLMVLDIDAATVRAVQANLRVERGGFGQRLNLL